jgi:hypothetical protein
MFIQLAANGQGLPKAGDFNDTSRLAALQIYLLIGEANMLQAFGKPYVLVAQLTLCS